MFTTLFCSASKLFKIVGNHTSLIFNSKLAWSTSSASLRFLLSCRRNFFHKHFGKSERTKFRILITLSGPEERRKEVVTNRKKKIWKTAARALACNGVNERASERTKRISPRGRKLFAGSSFRLSFHTTQFLVFSAHPTWEWARRCRYSYCLTPRKWWKFTFRSLCSRRSVFHLRDRRYWLENWAEMNVKFVGWRGWN